MSTTSIVESLYQAAKLPKGETDSAKFPKVETIVAALGKAEKVSSIFKVLFQDANSLSWRGVILVSDTGVHFFLLGNNFIGKNRYSYIPFSQIVSVVARKIELSFHWGVNIQTTSGYWRVYKSDEEHSTSISRSIMNGIAAPQVTTSLYSRTEELKVCPDCAESVKLAALKCRYCGYLFSATF